MIRLSAFLVCIFACQKSADSRAQNTGPQAGSSSAVSVAISAPVPVSSADSTATSAFSPSNTSNRGSESSAASRQPASDKVPNKAIGDGFEVSAKIGPKQAGNKHTVTVELTPTGKYKMNHEYPTKIVFSAKGASPASYTIKKKDAQSFSDKGAVFRASFTADGKAVSISAKCRFAICTADECVPRKATVSVTN